MMGGYPQQQQMMMQQQQMMMGQPMMMGKIIIHRPFLFDPPSCQCLLRSTPINSCFELLQATILSPAGTGGPMMMGGKMKMKKGKMKMKGNCHFPEYALRFLEGVHTIQAVCNCSGFQDSR